MSASPRPLQDSSWTLISSSLVSKKWALSTRRHLFSNITISVGRGIGRFGDLFHSSHATITPFVKLLSLVAAGAQCSTDGEQRLLIQLLSKLGVVPFHTFSLEFREQDGYVLKKDPLSAQARGLMLSYHAMVNLHLHCEFSTITDLVELICSLPLLEVADLSVPIHKLYGDPHHRPPSTLRLVICTSMTPTLSNFCVSLKLDGTSLLPAPIKFS